MIHEFTKILIFFLKCVFTISALIAITIFMASQYNDGEFYSIPLIVIIVAIILFFILKTIKNKFGDTLLPRKYFIYHAEKTGSVIYTEANKYGLYPYRKLSPIFSFYKDPHSRVYYITRKTQKSLYFIHSLTIILVVSLLSQMGSDLYRPYVAESSITFLCISAFLIFISRKVRNSIITNNAVNIKKMRAKNE